MKNEKRNYIIAKYEYKNNYFYKIMEDEKMHKGKIISCFELNDGIIASAGNDNWIKFWK